MQERIDRINEVLREQITGIRVVRAFVREPDEAERFGGANDDLTLTSLRAGRLMAFMFPTVMLVVNVSSVAAIWIGGDRIANGDMQIGALIAFLSYLIQILMSVMMATFVAVLAPRASVSAERIEEVLDVASRRSSAPADPVTELAADELARAPRRRVRVPGRRLPGALRHLVHAPSPARPPRSSAAPAPARPRCSTSSRACSTPPAAPCSSTASTCATSNPSCSGAASGSCRRSRTSSRAPSRATCATRTPTRPTTSSGRRSRSRRPQTFVSAMPRRPRLPDQPGRHQRVGRAAPAARDRPRAGAPPRHLPVRRLVLGARPRHRRPPAGRARAGRRRRGHRDRRPAGLDDHQRRPDPRDRGRPPGRARHAPRAARDLPHLRRDRRVPAHRGGGGESRPRAGERSRGRASDGTERGIGARRRDRGGGRPAVVRRAARRLRRALGRGRPPARALEGLQELDAAGSRHGCDPRGSASSACCVLAVASVTLFVLAPKILGQRHQHHRRRRRIGHRASTSTSCTGSSLTALADLRRRRRSSPTRRRTSSPASCSGRCSGCAPTSRTSSTGCRCATSTASRAATC